MRFSDLLKSWNVLVRFPVPVADPESRAGQEGPPGTLLFMPVIGLVVGLAGVLLAGVLLVLSEQTAAAALIGAVGTPVLMWWLTRWRGLSGLHATVEREFSEQSGSNAFYIMLLFQLLLLIKCVCIGLLIYHVRISWIAAAAVLGASAYTHAWAQAGSPADLYRDRGGEAAHSLGAHAHWLVAGALVLISGGIHHDLFEAALTAVLVWLATPVIRRVAQGGHQPDSAVANLTMEMAELLALVAGAFLIFS